MREAYGLARVASFADITSDLELQQTLEDLYGTVDNIDLWVGLLAEDHVSGSSVGELSQEIIVDQFERLRDGDRFWYQNVFSGRALAELEQTTLADVIRRNTTINNLQGNVFFMQAELTGQVFADANRNGRQDRQEDGLRGVTVELLNDEGDVVATTTTDRDGRYRFDQFAETGDYQVRVIPPSSMTSMRDTREVLISRGGLAIRGVDFGLQPLHATNDQPIGPTRGHRVRPDRFVAIDTVFDMTPSFSLMRTLDGASRLRARNRW